MLELGAFSSSHKSCRHRLLITPRDADCCGAMPSLLERVNCRDALPGSGGHAPVTQDQFWRKARSLPIMPGVCLVAIQARQTLHTVAKQLVRPARAQFFARAPDGSGARWRFG